MGFTLAVLICCEDDFRGSLCRTLQIGHRFLTAIGGDINGFKIVVEVNAELAGRPFLLLCREITRVGKIADVTDRSHDLITIAEVFADGFCLRR